MADTVGDLLQRLGADGWAGLEGLGDRAALDAARHAEAQLVEADAVTACLRGPNGAAFIEWLARITILRSPNDAERTATTLEAYALAKARREGQNDVFFMVIQALMMARGETKRGGSYETANTVLGSSDV